MTDLTGRGRGRGRETTEAWRSSIHITGQRIAGAYTPKSKTRNRIPGTNCPENACRHTPPGDRGLRRSGEGGSLARPGIAPYAM
eukprot:441495-Rhodomonas_salina.7